MFPQLPPDFSDRVRNFLPTLEPPSDFFFYNYSSELPLLQGDILGPITYGFDFSDGLDKIATDVLLLSNTCDLDRKKHIIVCPALFLDEEKFQDNFLKRIKSNIIFDMLYLPENQDNPKYIVHFSKTFHFPNKKLKSLINDKSIERKSSLSKEGFYFLLLKYTVFIMRPETHKIERRSNI